MKSGGNKYSRLLSNTALFGISTFSSKALAFFLTRLYTTYLTEAELGRAETLVQIANLLIPLVSLGISNAVIRFGLEKDISKKSVYSSGFVAIGSGFAILLIASPFIAKIEVFTGYMTLLCVYVLVSCLRTLNCQFVRAKLQTRLYALDGLLTTGYTIGFNVLFLVVLDMGAVGYLLAVICADALSALFLFLVAKLRPYIQFKKLDWSLIKTMLRYSLPLVPALMFWWVTNGSDRLFIWYMINPAASGVYSVANRIPTIVTVFSTIFTEAWQLSAVTDGQGKDQARFFTQVFSAVSGIAFTIGGLLILCCQLIMRILAGTEGFYAAWQYVPFLILATIFSSMVAFQNSVYMVKKKSNLSLATMVVGAVANLILNALLIPRFGVQGATIATAISYILVFIIRGFNTRRMIRIDFKSYKVVINTVLIILESILLLLEVTLWPLWCGIILFLLVVINIASLYKTAMQLLHRGKGSQKWVYQANSEQNVPRRR